MAHNSMTLVRFLLNNGWMHSAYMDALSSPEGVVVPLTRLVAMEPTFQRVARSQSELDAFTNDLKRVGADNTLVTPGRNKPEFPGKWGPYDKLKMRLGMAKADTFDLDYCHIFEGTNRTYVFVVKGDKALILEDEPALFPSDSLVAQFQLFREAA